MYMYGHFAVHLLATTTNVTTNNIKVPYKMLYLDSKSVTCPFSSMLPRQLATEYPPIHANKRSPTVEVPIQSTNNCSVSDNNLITERDPSCFQGNYQLVLTFMLTSNKSVTLWANTMQWLPCNYNLHIIGLQPVLLSVLGVHYG